MFTYQALHIPEPCTKIHYDDLPYDPDKRPCHLCQKPVYDFRDKDEFFLQKVWQENKGDFCGTFRYHQFTERTQKPIVASFFQRAKIYWASACLYLFSQLFNPSKAQESSAKAATEQYVTPTDSSSIQLHAKKGKKLATFISVEIFINEVKYNSYYIRSDTIEVKLPSSVKPTDEIKIERKVIKRHQGWTTTVIKNKAIVFKFGSRELVEIRVTRRKRLNLIYKRDRMGCPKFR
ncbi:MAG: hypothetical protein H7282_13565 [Cytophagaceae bacterium]|nr:hypothetical protein [Cytophagaceae bacterium]